MLKFMIQKIFSRIIISILVISIVSCSSVDEPIVNNEDTSVQSRAVISSWHSLSESEVVSIADNAIGKSSVKPSMRKLEVLMIQDKSLSSLLISDTIAYIVNYVEEGGFAVIANDSRVAGPLAYGRKGSIQNSDSPVKFMFLDKIEAYLATLQSNEISNNVPSRHLIVEPQISVELGPWYPFNKKIEKKYPGHYASGGCLAAAGIISCLRENLVYHNYEYNFPKIIYAYNQGPGFDPIVVEPYLTGINGVVPTQTFKYSYEGSIDAFNQLLYNLSEDSKTVYNYSDEIAVNSETTPLYIMQTLRNMNFEVSGIQDNNIRNITSSLLEERLINMWGYTADNKQLQLFDH